MREGAEDDMVGLGGEGPLISVVVPVYQSERWLDRCVGSLLGQTYQNLEIILVDDGSTDRSPEICDSYGERDERVRVIHRQNGGVSSARNAGMDAMTGDYLMLIDGDDYVSPYMAERLLEAVCREGADLSICGFEFVFEDRRPPDKRAVHREFQGTREEFAAQCFVELYDKLLINTQSNKLYSTSLIRRFQVRYEESMAINEDLMFCLRVIGLCRRIACIPFVGLFYWQHEKPDSLVKQFHVNGVDTCFALLEAMEDCLERVGADEEAVNQMGNRMIFHICGFAGLPYYRSDYTNRRCLELVRNLAAREAFQELLWRTKARGLKNRMAKLLLGRGWCRLYHVLCLVIYGKKRKEYRGRAR